MRRQAVEARALVVGTPQPRVSEAGAQTRRPGPGAAVEPLQRTGTGHGAGAERSRPDREGTGPVAPGGRRPEPQDETKHVAAVGTVNGGVECLSSTGIRCVLSLGVSAP